MIKLIAYTTDVIGNEILIRDSEGESIQSSNVNELLEFLNEPYTDEVQFSIKVFWNLDEAIAPILRKLGIAACRQLASPEHTYKNLFYITSKIFIIRSDKQSSFFYHLCQYYPDSNENPTDPFVIHGMAQAVMDAFHAMGLHPKKLTSAVAVYESEVLKHLQIPTIANINGKYEGLIDYAEDCIGRTWTQAYQVGHWQTGEIWEYDQKSAYPAICAKLRSLQYAKYAHLDYIDDNADWGFLKGEVTIYDDVKVSPIFYEDSYTLSQRTGTYPTTITLHDYRNMMKWGYGEFKIKDGYFIKFTAPVCPMEQPLKRLFNQRGTGGMINTLAKSISVAVGYGKFLQKNDKGEVGFFYNPPYAAMINSIANCKITDFIYENKLQDDLVHVGVDGVIATKEAKLGDQNRVGWGQWRLVGIGAVIVLSSGRVYHGDKKPHGLNYEGIIELINQSPRQSYYTAHLKRRQTLEESIQLNDLNGLGKMKDTKSSFDLNLLRGSQERYFPEFPMTGEQLLNHQYKSFPLKAENNH